MLHTETPVEHPGNFHVQIMRIRDVLREILQRPAGGIFQISVVDQVLLDERHIIYGAEDEIAFDALIEHAEAAAQGGPAATRQIIGKTDARRPSLPIRVGSALRQVVKQRLHSRIVVLSHAALRRLWKSAAPQNPTVIWILG